MLLAADFAGDMYVGLIGVEPRAEPVVLNGEDIRALCRYIV